MLTPLFAMLGSCDQTATDLGTRHIRFLIPRVGRAEIFVARFVGAAILVTRRAAARRASRRPSSRSSSTAAATSAPARSSRYGAQVTGFLIVYSLPIVALMSLVSAAMASVGLALLVGLGGYAILAVALSADAAQGRGRRRSSSCPAARAGLKPYLLQPELGPALAACAGRSGYVALYAVPGLAGVSHAGRLMQRR